MECGSMSQPLICPCRCKGSIQYIHEECLREWVMFNSTSPRHTCAVCKGPYIWEGASSPPTIAEDVGEPTVRPRQASSMGACVVAYRWVWILVWLLCAPMINAGCRAYVPTRMREAVTVACDRLACDCYSHGGGEPSASLVLFTMYVLTTLVYDVHVMRRGGVRLWCRYRWGVLGACSPVLVLLTVILTNAFSSFLCGAYMGTMYVLCAVTCEEIVR